MLKSGNFVVAGTAYLLIVVAGLVIANNTFAFQLTPTVSVINLPADASGITLNLKNPRKVTLPVEFEIVERTVSEDGAETFTAADDLFLIFPPQAIIKSGEAQAVRVQWVDQAPEASRSFTLFAKEIPVELTGKDESMLQTLLRMGASVHVVSSQAKPEVSILKVAESTEGVRLTLGNSGNRFIYLNDVRIHFETKTYTGSELANIAGRTLLTPSGKRTIVIPNEKGRPRVSIAK
ncbi:fimbria/pilus periplasmic chaperone [Marinobacter sp. X15-166B]|uniref:fimbria/pilus periplasmic chaperone n=1 Tax=Marinobacter sp. X15-166B TaxID=1897620 RepID=UPI00085CDD0D|nr:fimbria/pilus periplasmic chaperone [Marinobacter sp. X15-166B]OEY67348.1 hypothetical protein BG841_13475 [Marinobacter sp. X15-166B]